MFGHKSDNQTTVGAPVVQNPSMLDNVSAQDFSASDGGSADGDVQQQVEQALNQTEMNKMLDSAAAATPTVTGSPFMSSPAAEPTAVIAPAPEPTAQPVAEPMIPTPVSDPTPVVNDAPVSVPAPADNTVQEVAVNESDIPRPLSPEENREIEAMPVVSAVSSPASSDGSSAQDSLSAPVAPPPAPEGTPELPTMHPVDPTAETPSSDSNDSSAELSEDTAASSEEATSESPAGTPAESDAAVASDSDTTSSEQSGADEEKPDDTTDSQASSDSGIPAIDSAKLAEMKQQALDHLEPLADNLNQTPEEEFRTTMLRIQANDNHTLLEKALHAARNIVDDKERAQAMLDIINEINYFSQQAE